MSAAARTKPVRINLALQGGGAHGAFTWGVLDRLLETESLAIAWISGTSAGAVNAVALAAGYAEGGTAGARKRLAALWEGIYRAGVPDFLRFNPLFWGLTRLQQITGTSLSQLSGVLSPYDLNPLGFDPFRRVLEAHIDFDEVRAQSAIELMIAATEVASGRARLFRRRELTVEAVLASACLPTLHRAVEIGGRHYWDGGFSANPELIDLVGASQADDTLIVQINPTRSETLPTRARDIAGEVNRLTFNAPLLAQIELIVALRAAGSRWLAGAQARRLARHRFHLIEAGPYTARLPHESKLKPDWNLLSHLFAAGRAETERWLAEKGRFVGLGGTVDLARHYLDDGPAPPPAPASLARSAEA